MANKTLKPIFRYFSYILLLSIAPGCDYFNKTVTTAEKNTEKKEAVSAPEAKSDGSRVLCNINGKPAITENEFAANLTQMLNANPYFGGASVDSLPGGIKRKFFDELVKQELIIAEQKNNNVEANAQFIKACDDMIRLVKRSLMVEFFQKNIFDSLDVSESKIANYFKENKEKYIKTPGGTLLQAVSFDSEEKAAEFLKKAQESVDSFATLGKELKDGSFRDFGRVSETPSNAGFRPDIVPAQLKKAALALSKLPAVDSVKVDKKTYVFKVADKKETEYFELDEIRTQVEGMLKNSLFKEELDKKLAELKDKYTVSINEEFFTEKASSAADENIISEDDSEESEGLGE